ncbi:hypothetical protein SteCoe_26458 [Stentor coeruleus]|uniref:Peptidase A1 domain-containing protein n=1 Tax=Stentor coeruleus TaxID=5963 RepID=A0A1R2BCW5_9CILI|nr:hypothetical protein SteCoe_26458 [Stentor coeruleus]
MNFFLNILCVAAYQEVLHSNHIVTIPLRKIVQTTEEKQEIYAFLMNFQSSMFSSNMLETMNGKLRLKNFSNSQYVGRVGVGTPPQYLDVIFDTGSANFWINSKLCNDLACETHDAYDSLLSNSYEKLGYVISVEFGTGEIRGEINYETITVAGISLQRQSFGEITDEIGEVFVQGKFSGILGLAFPTMAAFNFDPIFDSMMSHHSLDNNLFTFYYSENESSEVAFGGIDYSKFEGEILWNEVIEEYYWVIIIDDIKIGGKSLGLCPNGCKAAVDTGTSFLTAPPEEMKVLAKEFDLNCENTDLLPNLVFQINGKDFSVSGKDIVFKGPNTCTLAIMPLKVPKPL